MVYLGIEFSIGRHGGGTHQWNVPYQDVQYGWQVSQTHSYPRTIVQEKPQSDNHLCPYIGSALHAMFNKQPKYTNYGDILYSLALFFTKFSLMLLILRVFCSVDRDTFYWLTQALIVVNSLFYLLFFFIPIFVCSPRSKIWNPDIPGHCLRIKDLYLASAIFNSFSDIAMLSVPLYLIWKLQMSVRRKVGVSLIFLTGAL